MEMPTGRTFTGAWIETWVGLLTRKGMAVAPSRVRGLKHYLRIVRDSDNSRTFTGAWIETDNTSRYP